MDYNSFLQLLGSMTSSDNEERKNAEEIFGNLVQSNGILVIQLLFTVFQQNQANINLIIFTLILLTNIYKRFPSVFQTDSDSIVQSFLLNLLDNPLNNTIFQSTSSTLIAAAAKFYVPNHRWPTFPSDMIQRYASDNISTILISLDCLIICIHAHLFDFPTLVPVVDSLFQKFWESPPSQIHLHLITLIFIMFQNQAVCQCFEPFVVSFPQLLFRLDSIKLANLLVSELTNYANSIIPIFQSHFTSFFECLIQILSDTGRDSGQRKLCLELLCEISESNPCEMSPTIEILYTTLMNLICEISGPDFLNEDYEDPTPRTAAENSLFRFSSSFYKFSLEQNSDCFPKLLLSIFDQFNQCTGSFEKYRAGYVLLRETFDILVPSFVNGELVENLVRKIIEGLQCHNVFCEIAIFQVLTQAALQLSIRDFEKDYNSILIPAIIGYVTSNIGNSRYALESLSCLISNSKDEDIDGIFDQLFTFITQIFEGIPLQAKLYALKCITSLIQKSKNRITSFYPIVLTILVEVIKSNELSLQIESIMAFSMIGFVLPQCDDASTELMDKFAKDSQGFIQLIMSINRSTLTGEQDDTLNQALQLLVWTLGPHYPDAFSTLLASQLEIAAQDINMKTVPLSSDRSDFEGDIMLPNKTENMLYIYNKAQIDVVEHTLAIISSFLLKIGGHSLSLFPQLIEVFSKTISYFFYSVLQDETLQCLYGLVTTMYENKCESYNDLALVINSFNSVCDNLYEGEDTVSSFIDFAITLAYCSPNLELGLAQTFLVLVEKCIQSFSDDSSQIHTSCALLLKAITKSSNVNQEIVGKLQEFSQTCFPSPDKAEPYLIDGSIIFWSSLVVNIMHNQELFDHLFDFSCAYINSPENEVTTEFLMSLPTFLESEMFGQQHLEKFIPVLTEFLSYTNPDDEETKIIIDAAIYSLTCLFIKLPDTTQNTPLLTIWYSSLPLRGKKDPCFQKVYDVLVQLVSQNNPIILGNLHHLLTIIAKAMKEYNASKKAQASFEQIVKQLFETPQIKDQFCQELNQLTHHKKERILSLFHE